MIMKRYPLATSIGGALLVAGCVVMPTAPMVTVFPGTNKPFDQFQADDMTCRNYAYSGIAGPSQAATNTAAANTAAATVLGAAAGALIGSATGSAGAGAAIGAGTGLLFGGAANANALGYSSYDLQRQFDNAYIQCMYVHGNRVPMRMYGRGYGVPRGYGAPAYVPPTGSEDVPPDYVPTPTPGSIPPPDTPPPRGMS
jgi:hypothetical protein